MKRGEYSVDFGRLITAMITTFDDKGQLDLDRQTTIIEHLIKNGTETIIVCGTTGESPTLSKHEKMRLFEHTLETVNGRVKVLLGTGGNNTQESVALTREVEDLPADGIMLVTPYYNRPNQEGMYQHFKATAESTERPIMLYNVPGRTSVNMNAETVCRLAEISNITMVKEASEDLGQMVEIIANTPDDFVLYSGDDSLTLPVLSIGGYGVVSVASHILGVQMRQMMDCYVNGQVLKASKLHQKMYHYFQVLFSAPSPVPLKKALEILGFEVGSVRLPLVPLSHEEEIIIRSYFGEKIIIDPK